MLGTSFSPRHAESLGLDPHLALQRVLDIGLSPIRLGAYWDEIQPMAKMWDFSQLKWQLEMCQERHVPVVLTVGAKAPRWPEFYEPVWAQSLSADEYSAAVLEFVRQTVLWAQEFSCIHTWQVENEALDPSGPESRSVPLALLQAEVELTQATDIQGRPVLLTAWGNELRTRQQLPRLAPLADAVGIDLYPKVFWKRMLARNMYLPAFGFWSGALTQTVNFEKPLWIAELQAEPWEESDSGYRSSHPASMSPSQLISNWRAAQSLHPTHILLWGCEYWLWREDNRDPRFVQVVKKLVKLS
jgi:hypothetical protein